MLKKRVHVRRHGRLTAVLRGDPLTSCKQVVSTCYNKTRPRIAPSLSRETSPRCEARILSSYSRERKSARRMRKGEAAINISSATISSVSIYDDEVTRYRVRECRAFECKRLHIRRYIFPLSRENPSLSKIFEKEEKKREAERCRVWRRFTLPLK